MRFLANIPYQVKSLLKQLLLVLVLMILTRIIFFGFNTQSFNGITLYDFLIGSWFDCITIALLFLPYAILFLLPLRINHFKWYRFTCRLLFSLTTLLVLGLNLMDVEYFKFTSKRSTIDLLTILGAGSDLKQLITTFLSDFWYLILFFFLFLFVTIKVYNRIVHFDRFDEGKKSKFYLVSISQLLIFVGFLIFVGRGGFVFKPVGVLDASRYVNSTKTAFVLNTPFTMLKSINAEGLKEEHYFPSIKATENYFNPIKRSHPQNILPGKPNVVILILESFGKEFIGYYNNGKSYTPFLDSLLDESMTFTKGFANGKKSIEAVPSIFASIPSLQDEPYISSQYNSNRVVGLPEILRGFGYESAFYHGATNGSMRFDSFADYIGFDHYIGKKEYGNEAHSDKTWGILDEYFNPWSARQMSKLKQPFLASLFTLSSHHPYFVPENRRGEVINGPQPLCASISYGDLSLRLFFEEAKKQPWYDNTVFIICADHTPGTSTAFYNLQTQLYQIPFAIYHPSGKIPKGKNEQIFQQIDIYPTVLDLLNIETTYYSFGNSLFSTEKKYSISYLEGNYFYFRDNRMLVFSQNQARNLYDFTSKSSSLSDLLSGNKNEVLTDEKYLEAIIQRYNNDLIRNKTTVIK